MSMLLRILFICLFSITATRATGAQGPVLVVGDSLSAAHDMAVEDGWVALLAEHLAGAACPLPVINASISGETTIGGLTRLPGLLARHQPSIVIIELGGNDGLRGQPVSALRENLSSMIELAREAGAKVLLVGIRIPSNYGRRYGEAFRAVYPALAAEYGTALVPFLLEGVALEPALMQADQIHPRAEAQPRLLANVLPALDGLLPGCATAP